MNAADIESVSIHPAIGIARVGNSPDAWFYAPDVRGAVPQDPDDFRDMGMRIKRQVARFRVYAKLKNGDVQEVTSHDAKITWRVEVANLKAGWYEYLFPMDLPAEIVKLPRRRNPRVGVVDRHHLDIRPVAKTISGADVEGAQYQFNDGAFFGKEVYLGELRTDAKGRLLFFGGRGISAPRLEGTKPTTFANNDDWHDDVCDGPVRAEVEIGGVAFTAAPAHVVVTPPNYGPGLFGIVTMDDVVQELFVNQGWFPEPAMTSFTCDIWPIFDRFSGHQWVNDGILLVAGQGTPLDARDPEVIARMTDTASTGDSFRRAVFALFRRTEPPQALSEGLPPFYGDTYGDDVDETREGLLLTSLQYRHLQRWADGNFDSDWRGFPKVADFDTLPPAEQCQELDRAGLYECLGGPFHPGIEMTWPLRLATLWKAPYRLRTLAEGEAVRQDFGPILSREAALAADGPHGSCGAGSMTRWMGVPWQTDEASCDSGRPYTPSLFLSTPSFWGARVPNQILPFEAFSIATAPDQSAMQAQRHFSARRGWLRDIDSGNYLARIDRMVSRWWQVGLVTAKSPPHGSGLPEPCFVETGRAPAATNDDPTLKLAWNVLALAQEDVAGLAGAIEAAKDKGPKPTPTYPRYGRGEV